MDNDRNTSSLLLNNTSDLMGHKSVRATFRLLPDFIEAISILSTQLGLKQKSLFDHLLEDTDALLAIASTTPKECAEKSDRVQKTFVISKRSLTSLEKVLEQVEASRDDLVEFAIQRLRPLLLKERNQQNKRESLLDKIAFHLERSIELLDDIEETVGKSDPLYQSFASVVDTYRRAFDDMENRVEQGKRITKLRTHNFQL